MKRFLMFVFVSAFAATIARGDGYPEEKYEKEKDPCAFPPALKAPPKEKTILTPGSYKPDPELKAKLKPEKPTAIVMPVMHLDPLPPKNVPKALPSVDSRPWKFWSGLSLFGGSGRYIGARVDGGWFPAFLDYRASLNLGFGGVHISDHRGLSPEPNFELNRGYGRISATYWAKYKNMEFPLGIFHDRGINSNIENTYRRTGIMAGVFYKKVGLGLDIGNNVVTHGFTPKGPDVALSFNYRFF